MNLTPEHRQGYTNYLESIGLQDVTREKYELYLGHYINLFDGIVNQKFIDNFLTIKKHDPNHITCIKHLLSFLKRSGNLSKEDQIEISLLNILKPSGKKPRKEKPTLSESQIKRVFEECNIDGSVMKTGFFKFEFLFQYEMGLRLSEVSKLRWDIIQRGINLPSGYKKMYIQDITKNKKGGYIYLKNSIVDDYVGFVNRLALVIKKDINESKVTLWNNCSVSSYASKLKREVMKILGINLSSHSLRHSKATNSLRKGMPLEQVKELLRHEDISTTSNYLHNLNLGLEESLNNDSKDSSKQS